MPIEDNPDFSLYNRFIDDLKKSPESMYYDEDDLIEIFDMASDNDDMAVRLEVLILGAKLFPNSDDLLKRRAVMLIDAQERSLDTFMQIHSARISNDFLWKLLRIRALDKKPEQITAEIKDLLTVHRLEDDEEIIQLVSVIHKFFLDDWLFKNLEWAKSRVAYPNTLLYELARVAQTGHQLINAHQIMESLTDEDPMNFNYWCAMADILSSMGKFEDALNALGYAKALNSSDYRLESLEGYLHMQLNHPIKAVEYLERAVDSTDPDVADSSLQNLILAYKQLGDIPNLKAHLIQLFAKKPSDEQLLIDILAYCEAERAEALERFHNESWEIGEEDTIRRVGQLVAENHLSAAIFYMNWYLERNDSSDTMKFSLVELLYAAGKYSECYDFIDRNFNGLILEPAQLSIIIVIVSTFLRTHNFIDAFRFSEHWIAELKKTDFSHSSYGLIVKGLNATLSEIIKKISDSGTLTEAEIEELAL